MSNKINRIKGKSRVQCIDLPGQAVQCWSSSTAKIQIVLRKHRDVIFDIKMFKGMTYEVVAKYSPMYDSRSKKMVEPNVPIKFQDGEQLHIWVGRDFVGEILLMKNSSVLGRYNPGLISPFLKSYDPLDKPPPMIIAMNNEAVSSRRRWRPDEKINSREFFFLPSTENKNYFDVVEIDLVRDDLPEDIARFVRGNGDEALVGPHNIVTFNWVMNAMIGQAGFANDNLSWIKERWDKKLIIVRIKHAAKGKKFYAVIKRRGMAVSSALTKNEKMLSLSFGAASVAGLRHASWASVKGAAQTGGLLAICFTAAIDIAEWFGDYQCIDPVTGKRKKDIIDLLVKIGLDVAKGVLVGVLSSATMWLGLTLLAITTGVALPAYVIVVLAVVVTIGVGYAVDYLDKEYGASDKLTEWIMKSINHLERKMPKDYAGYGDSLRQALAIGGLGA